MRVRPLILCAAALLGATEPAIAQSKLPPVDQCSSRPGFNAFRQALTRAVARQDRAALMKLVAPDVMVSLGGDRGRQDFVRHWDLSPPRQSGVWRELRTVLGLGCARVGNALVMPSLSGQFSPDNEQDAFEKVVVVSSAARLRRTRDPASAVVTVLGWDVVTAVEAPDDKQMKVRLADGGQGWLWQREVRSPLDYRLSVERRGGRWTIVAFVAGD